MSETQARHRIRLGLRRSNRNRGKLIREAILTLASRQTLGEQAYCTTYQKNRLGFSLATVQDGMRLAIAFRDGSDLTPKGWWRASEIVWTHARQLGCLVHLT